MGLFDLASGGSYCRVPKAVAPMSFAAGDSFCKSVGLSGLLELRTPQDVVRVAGINACEYCH